MNKSSPIIEKCFKWREIAQDKVISPIKMVSPLKKIVLQDIIEKLHLYESKILNVNCYKNQDNSFVVFEQRNFYKYAKEKHNLYYKDKASKVYVADLWVMKDEKDLFLIEIKSQTSSSSAKEKIYGGLMLNLIYKRNL